MRSRRVATALVALTAGVTAVAATRRAADRRTWAIAADTGPAAALPPPALPALEREAPDRQAPVREADVLPFPARPVVTEPVQERPTAPARCGDTGGRTKAGAPCGARAGAGGRCHHHPVAA